MTLLAIRLVELRHVKFRDTFQGIYLENQTVVGSDIHITAKSLLTEIKIAQSKFSSLSVKFQLFISLIANYCI